MARFDRSGGDSWTRSMPSMRQRMRGQRSAGLVWMSEALVVQR
jgi:hypothetical protein